MVQSPDKSLGSVLTGAFGWISGLSALTSSSSWSRLGTAGVFFPKILESNVAILQFSFQGCALSVGNAYPNNLTGSDITIDMHFVIGPCPPEIILFDKDVLCRTGELRSLRRRNPIDKFQAAPVTFFNQ
jgi:hypothetical protein